MKIFNILDKDQSIHRHAMIEASAGTGKTFAIENLVVRLLIDSSEQKAPLTIEQILVVTFTRAATRDLKLRIRANLEKVLETLRKFAKDGDIAKSTPDYLLVHLHKSSEDVLETKRRVEAALFSFDRAEVFTIHAFCSRMLQKFAFQGKVSLEPASSEEKTVSKYRLLQVVQDFIRTELSSKEYCSEQIKIALKLFKGRLDQLESELLQKVSKGIPILAPPGFSELADSFSSAMHRLKSRDRFSANQILEDFLLHVPAYRGLCNRKGDIHKEVIETVSRFARLFDQQTWTTADFEMLVADGLVVVDALSPSQRSAKGAIPSPDKLHYPHMIEIFALELAPIVKSARDPNKIFAKMAEGCRALFCRYLQQEEVLGFTELLHEMLQASKNPLFADHIRESYHAVIVDEFQDTDPVQWEIFDTLFLRASWPGHLYLVGDPKQSIYAFRQADIYTYLKAASSLGSEAAGTLNTNYRSEPKLVDALNLLFSKAKDLFPLPRGGNSLAFHPVCAGKEEESPFSDQGASLQFLVAEGTADGKRKGVLHETEENVFFPAILKEVIHLHKEDKVPLNRIAILVSDRFQAERVSSFLKKRTIQTISQRGNSLNDSEAVSAMRELLIGIIHCKRPSALKIALGGRLIGMTHLEIVALETPSLFEAVLDVANRLRALLINEGFFAWVPAFMESCWRPCGKTVLEQLLSEEGGGEFYREWQDIAEILIEEESEKNLSANGVVAFLDEFELMSFNDDERIKQSVDTELQGVQILTTHASKGLEFDVVFTLGLIKRSSQNELLIPTLHDGKVYLEAACQEGQLPFQDFVEEIDAEKMRQLYVAMTRAKYRLYLPVAFGLFPSAKPGEASPMELFLARLFPKNSETHLQLYETINGPDSSSWVSCLEETSSDISMTFLKNQTENTTQENVSCEEAFCRQLIPVQIPIISGQPSYLQSFTSLSRVKTEFGKVELKAEERNVSADAEALPPHDYLAEIMTPHTLPAGSQTGILLHKIFEKIPFDAVRKMAGSCELIPLISPWIDKTPLMPWKETVAEIVYLALTTPLPGYPSFCLADVASPKMFKEADFLFPASPNDFFENTQQGVLHGYINGIIDLMFEHQGKYYLLDWKSNWLGASISNYHHESLLTAMQENQYELQAAIYTEALRKYLKLFDPRPFEELFGGAYYFFLRGIGSETGIYRANPPLSRYVNQEGVEYAGIG